MLKRNYWALIAIVFIFQAHAPSAIAVDVTATNDKINISGDFFTTNWSPSCQKDVDVTERFRIPAGTGPPNCDGRFTEIISDQGKSSALHFEILSGDGLCILLDARLGGNEVIIGENNSYALSLPIDEVLTYSSLAFLGSAAYDEVDEGAAGFDSQGDFKLVPGEDYRVDIMEQVTICDAMPSGSNVGERLIDSLTFSVPCCFGPTGNVDFDPDHFVDIADLTFLIDHLFINFPPLPCFDEANVDGAGNVDITDLTALISHLYEPFDPIADCP